jgi:hypothetical protein
MYPGVLLRIIYTDRWNKWVATKECASNQVGSIDTEVEVTFLSILCLLVQLTIVTLFTTDVNLDINTAVGMVYIYSVTCLVLSNEYLLTD